MKNKAQRRNTVKRQKKVKTERDPAFKNRVFTDTLKLLALHPKFLSEAMAIRKRGGMPPEGFLQQSDIDDWLATKEKEDFDYIASLVTQNKSREEVRQNLPSQSLHFAVDNLLGVLKLSASYRKAVHSFVFYNYFPQSVLISCKSWEIGSLSENTETSPMVTINIYSLLSEREAKLAIKTANRMFKINFPYHAKEYKPYQNIDRDINILKLTKEKGALREDHAIKTDADIVASIFSNEDDISTAADKKRSQIVWSARRSLQNMLRKRFPPDTFPPA